MELTESIESINKQLENLYGIDTISSRPMFRVVFSEDQFEKRLTNYTKEGFELLTPVIMELPKYRQWIQQKYVLERLVIVPEFQQHELAGEKVSYEPVYIFETKTGKYLPPRLDVAKIIIDSLYAAIGKKSMYKYVDKDSSEFKDKRIEEIEQYLYGNETDIGDALAQKSGVGYTGHNNKESE